MNSGVRIDTLSLGVHIIAKGEAPALTGTLSFDNSLPAAPTLVDTGAGPNLISVAWLSPFNPPLSGTKAVGSITMTIPSKARPGDSYTLRVTGASATLGTNSVSLSGGPDSTLGVVK